MQNVGWLYRQCGMIVSHISHAECWLYFFVPAHKNNWSLGFFFEVLSSFAFTATDDRSVDAILCIKYNKSMILAETTAWFMSLCGHTHTDANLPTDIRPHAVKDTIWEETTTAGFVVQLMKWWHYIFIYKSLGFRARGVTSCLCQGSLRSIHFVWST